MKQSNTLIGIVAGVAFALPYAVASEMPITGYSDNERDAVNQIFLADNTYGSSKSVDSAIGEDSDDYAVIGGDAPNPEPDRSLSTTADDAAITAKVKSKLLADTTVGGLKIDADTRSGVVYLTSEHMNSQSEIDTAIKLAKDTSGVKDVVSKLTLDDSTD